MAKKASKKIEPEPMKLFYIFYNQERWDNWLKSLKEASFEADPKAKSYLKGSGYLTDSQSDITVSVLKIIKLYQNKRYTFEEAVDKLSQVEAIVMSPAPEGELGELVELLQLPNWPSLPLAGSTLPGVLIRISRRSSRKAKRRGKGHGKGA